MNGFHNWIVEINKELVAPSSPSHVVEPLQNFWTKAALESETAKCLKVIQTHQLAEKSAKFPR